MSVQAKLASLALAKTRRLGELGTYRTAAGDHEVHGLVRWGTEERPEGFRRDLNETTPTVTFAVADVGMPEKGDRFICSQGTFEMQVPERNDGRTVVMTARQVAGDS